MAQCIGYTYSRADWVMGEPKVQTNPTAGAPRTGAAPGMASAARRSQCRPPARIGSTNTHWRFTT